MHCLPAPCRLRHSLLEHPGGAKKAFPQTPVFADFLKKTIFMILGTVAPLPEIIGLHPAPPLTLPVLTPPLPLICLPFTLPVPCYSTPAQPPRSD